MPSLLLGESVKFNGYYCKVIEVSKLLNMVKIQFLTGSQMGETTWVYQHHVTPVIHENGKQ